MAGQGPIKGHLTCPTSRFLRVSELREPEEGDRGQQVIREGSKPHVEASGSIPWSHWEAQAGQGHNCGKMGGETGLKGGLGLRTVMGPRKPDLRQWEMLSITEQGNLGREGLGAESGPVCAQNWSLRPREALGSWAQQPNWEQKLQK